MLINISSGFSQICINNTHFTSLTLLCLFQIVLILGSAFRSDGSHIVNAKNNRLYGFSIGAEVHHIPDRRFSISQCLYHCSCLDKPDLVYLLCFS